MTKSINNEGQSTVIPMMNPVSNNVTNSNFDLHSPVISNLKINSQELSFREDSQGTDPSKYQ